MRIALWVYIALYAAGFTALQVSDRVTRSAEDRDPTWETVADIILLVTGLVGMLLFAANVSSASLKRAWVVVAVLLVVGQLFMFVRHLRSREATLAAADRALSNTEALVLEVGATVLLLPSLGVNVLYAIA